jgi:hypothetical protein
MDKIMQQGFNRSFCGKDATMYGKGLYFARDAAYSAYPIYAIPDKHNNQYVMACQVAVGEYCKGTQDALTPEIRDSKIGGMIVSHSTSISEWIPLGLQSVHLQLGSFLSLAIFQQTTLLVG